MIKVVRIEKDMLLREKAFSIREKVFVQEQQVARDLEYDEFEDTSSHYLALCDEEAAGTARWRKTAEGIKLERFAVLPQYRGKGVGAALVNAVVEDVRKTMPGKVYLHAQVQVIDFYERYGFEAVGDEFIEADIRHRTMLLSLPSRS